LCNVFVVRLRDDFVLARLRDCAMVALRDCTIQINGTFSEESRKSTAEFEHSSFHRLHMLRLWTPRKSKRSKNPITLPYQEKKNCPVSITIQGAALWEQQQLKIAT
jgi:hypothetical protein